MQIHFEVYPSVKGVCVWVGACACARPLHEPVSFYVIHNMHTFSRGDKKLSV